jgi:hypothetical protein
MPADVLRCPSLSKSVVIREWLWTAGGIDDAGRQMIQAHQRERDHGNGVFLLSKGRFTPES